MVVSHEEEEEEDIDHQEDEGSLNHASTDLLRPSDETLPDGWELKIVRPDHEERVRNLLDHVDSRR